jgi:hypothetical protein
MQRKLGHRTTKPANSKAGQVLADAAAERRNLWHSVRYARQTIQQPQIVQVGSKQGWQGKNAKDRARSTTYCTQNRLGIRLSRNVSQHFKLHPLDSRNGLATGCVSNKIADIEDKAAHPSRLILIANFLN